jgi:hypothetical protein
LNDANLPDGQANNARLKLYTAAMAEVAKSHGVLFVDLFAPTLGLYASSRNPLTINGIHLNEYGDELVSAAIEDALFPDGPRIKRDAAALARLRTAINDKNSYWFRRYRATDGYSTFGDRAFLRFTDGRQLRGGAARTEVIDITATAIRQVGGGQRPRVQAGR